MSSTELDPELDHRVPEGEQLPAAVRRHATAALPAPGWTTIVMLVVFAVLPLFLGDGVTGTLVPILCLSIAAVGFDLAWGFCGILSFGQAIFFGVGAYSTGLLAGHHGHTSLLLNLLVSAATAGLGALILGLFLFVGRRPVGMVFLAVSTLVLSYLASEYVSDSQSLGGDNGISGLPYPKLFGLDLRSPRSEYWAALILLAVCLAVVLAVLRTHFGNLVKAIRLDEIRVAHLGYNVTAAKIIVFVLAGAMTGAGASLYVFAQGTVTPDALGIDLSTQIVLWVIVGGTGTLIGGVLGATIFEFIGTQLTGNAAQLWPIVFGIVLVLAATTMPNGLLGVWRTAWHALRERTDRRG
jgi:branched-chain amino acid transport system permease protein